jgi:hypothetical protein
MALALSQTDIVRLEFPEGQPEARDMILLFIPLKP